MLWLDNLRIAFLTLFRLLTSVITLHVDARLACSIAHQSIQCMLRLPIVCLPFPTVN